MLRNITIAVSLIILVSLLALLFVIFNGDDATKPSSTMNDFITDNDQKQKHETTTNDVNNDNAQNNKQRIVNTTIINSNHKGSNDKKITSNGASSVFDASRNYRFSDENHELVINKLKAINTKRKNNDTITEQEVSQLWAELDDLQNRQFMLPAEVIQHKAWLVSLLPAPSAQLTQELQQAQHSFKQSVLAELQANQTSKANDQAFQAYKQTEQQLMQEMLAKYPNDTAKASRELEKALNQLHAHSN